MLSSAFFVQISAAENTLCTKRSIDVNWQEGVFLKSMHRGPIMQWTCPDCGKTMEVAESGIPKTGHCSHCRETQALQPDGKVKKSRFEREFWSFCLFFLLFIGCDTIGVGLGLLLPAIQAAREKPRREQCRHNLKAIGEAMARYHQEHGCFPPAYLADEHGEPMHSWRVLLLPYLGEQKLYSQYRLDEPWDGPHNKALAAHMPSVYRCPSDQSSTPEQTNYAMIVGPKAFSEGPKSHTLDEITDGPSHTILVAETHKPNIPWMSPCDLNLEKMLSPNAAHVARNILEAAHQICSAHTGMSFALFCDGSIRGISNKTLSDKELEALTTINQGDPVPENDGRSSWDSPSMQCDAWPSK
jgi:hypothetical protein